MTNKIAPRALNAIIIALAISPVTALANECKIVLGAKGNATPGTALMIRPELATFHEFTNIRNGHQQNPHSEKISAEYIGDYFYRQDPSGDFITAEIYIHGHPLSEQNSHTLALQSGQNSPALNYRSSTVATTTSAKLSPVEFNAAAERYFDAAYGERLDRKSREYLLSTLKDTPDFIKAVTEIHNAYNKQNQVAPVQAQNQNLPATTNRALTKSGSSSELTPEEFNAVAEKYMDTLYGPRLDRTSREYIKRTLKDSPEFKKHLAETRAAFENVVKLKVSNVGIDRYFWFQPKEQNGLVPARILDLHSYKAGGFTMLVEYMSPNNQMGKRVRNVIELTVSELASMTRDGNTTALSARQEFFDSLSPLEVETQKLATALRMKKFGFNSFGRTPGQKDDSNVRTPLQIMNNISWMAIEHTIRTNWGKIEHLKTPEENASGAYNTIDIFSRLDPKYVFKNFSRPDLEYMWIISEDGQLKVMPKMNLGNNLKPQILRLSSGRRIFAGGSFRFNTDGSLIIEKDSNDYQNVDKAWGSESSFGHDNPNLDRFITAVFSAQADMRVAQIDSRQAPSYFWRTSDNSHAGTYREPPPEDHKYSGDDAYDFVKNMRARGASSGEKEEAPQLEWDMKEGFPLFINEWVKASNTPYEKNPSENTLIKWAHYVLQTNHKMEWAEIKKRVRKLNSRFLVASTVNAHKGTQEEEAQQAVNRAVGILEKVMK